MTHLLLFIRLEHAENTVNGLAGINRVQRAHDQMSGFGGAESDFHGGSVTHFTYQNDLWRLAQSCSQSACEVIKVSSQFPLIDCGFLLGVNELDRILQCDDVNSF